MQPQADVVDLIKQLGHSKCILVAHDWGAAVAWSVARTVRTPCEIISCIVNRVSAPGAGGAAGVGGGPSTRQAHAHHHERPKAGKKVRSSCIYTCQQYRCCVNNAQSSHRSYYMSLFQMPWVPEQLLSLNDFQGIEEALTNRTGGVLNPSKRLTAADVDQFKKPFSFPGSMTAAINYYRANLSAKAALALGSTATCV